MIESACVSVPLARRALASSLVAVSARRAKCPTGWILVRAKMGHAAHWAADNA